MSMAATGCLMLLTLTITLTASLIFPLVYGADIESDKQALAALKKSLVDPWNVLSDWDVAVNPCTWNFIECENNRVTSVSIGMNNVGGNLVPELGGLSALVDLSIFNNMIEGTIPAELGNLQNLEVLSLSENLLSGEIPPSLGNLRSLVFVHLDQNEFTGKVSSQIGSLPSLKLANFSGNSLCWDFWPTPNFLGNYTLCQAE
ncbi:leucine-rich repeat protein 1-like [Rosa rugosa]|uniref:leucine-rich repeat protein 1-like n=1 Tax=Rosa rugosa TaxID=74645 RepID=UPI002B403B94|nr:leucine-rich repeat protein 1-like [Rosa rugosa]